MLAETFIDLFHSGAHWWFELLVGGIEEILFGVLIGAVIWPRIKKARQHHKVEEIHHASDDTDIAEIKRRLSKLEGKEVEDYQDLLEEF